MLVKKRSEGMQRGNLTPLCNTRLSIRCCRADKVKPGHKPCDSKHTFFHCIGGIAPMSNIILLYKSLNSPNVKSQMGYVDLCTFHCRVRVLLVRCESFGGSGTSGTLQCVVNEPASEHEPRTELYIANTLTQKTPNIHKDVRATLKCVPAVQNNESLPYVVVCRWP